MKYPKLFILLTIVFLDGCSDGYEQHYDKFSDFNSINQRNKGWFPEIISSDAYNIKNTSYPDSLCAFGTFSYSTTAFYDSIFKEPGTKKIDFSLFEQKVNEHIERKPYWFLNPGKISKSEFEAIQIERFYIVRKMNEKKIYFVLSN
ncbi:MAG: hypothetical protein ABI723_24710 [Bacteroidia bacterium]